MEDVNIVCVAVLVSEEYRITHYKTAWTGDRTKRLPATAINEHQYDYVFGFLWIAGSASLVLLQTQNIAGGKYPDSREKRLHGKTFRI